MKSDLIPSAFRKGAAKLVGVCILLILGLVSHAWAAEGASAGSGEAFWFWRFLGRLHPLAVHFPVSLLVFAAFLELFTLGNFNGKLRPGIRMLVLAGVAAAIVSTVFGILLANIEDYGGSTLELHRWAGLVTALIGIPLYFSLKKTEHKLSSATVKQYRAVLFVAAFGVSFAGHFGASLTHGEDYLTSVLPWNEGSSYAGVPMDIDLVSYQGTDLSEERQVKLVGQVRAIFAHNCYNCHSTAKIKGELRLDTKEEIFKGGESGPVIMPGDAAKSELVRRIKLPKDHKEAMPSKGKTLSKDEIALISLWIDKGAPWPDAVENQSVYRVAELAPRRPNLPASKAGLDNPVDLLVDDYFSQKSIRWKQAVDDKTFLRRVYLDIIGLLPTPAVYEAFGSDTRPDKRERVVDQLLARNDEYAIHWLTFWNDALRNDYTGTGYITRGRFAITEWLYASLRENKPYDLFVKQLLNPDEKSKGFIEGIRWRGDVNASQVTEMQAAQNVGQVILGLNLKCASCHDSFISDWKLEEAYAFANIFAEEDLDVARCETPIGKKASTKLLWEELGEIDSTANRAEKLRQLSEYLVQPANGRMYRTIVNRIWKQMMGRGLVEPVDEMDNEPWSQDLLDWLASDFADHGYDLRHLIRMIATSKAYQQPSISFEDPLDLVDERYVFEGMVRRRLTAEQFSDAVSNLFFPLFEEKQVKYDPFQLVSSETSKPEYPRASLVQNNEFLKALGRPNREIVSTSRDSQASLLQALELTNGETLNEALRKGAERWKEKYPDGEILIHQVFRQLFARDPHQNEYRIASEVLGESPAVEDIQDLFWALVLLPEFQLIY
ncbi:hypothetical protein ADIS_4415 [Lunatimonas lonarensis]|uniref:Cytochrome c domain-containing protein n=1 Tax=Lunatimonas lonarensis TaxID=1232681 RepID=R7ZMK5_9BACT|nr:PSD1 and planctomycete cytochrome C domain-containing protein [Lunatimonas lonarensis]EON75244.1 hypothetical protein ADIS_4415 [Lunatimonas lonarensis]